MKGRRILLVHNRYRQAGGEDRVVEAEAALLRERGHDVLKYTDDNDRIGELSRLRVAAETIWNHKSYVGLLSMIRREKIELCHFHNTFPRISPSSYYAARRAGVPVVQSLHNYRILCPNAQLMRLGKVCESCLGRDVVWPGALRRCYRNNAGASAVAAAMISVHRLSGTYARIVDRYIALTQFAKGKFIEGGLPAQRISVKPNFVDPDPGQGHGGGGYALFVGRLSPEKGIETLLRAWNSSQNGLPLRIAGVGPMSPQVRAAAAENPSIQWLGELPRDRVLAEMKSAAFLVCPSTWYESFGLIIVEAFSVGLPVIASDIGALAELIDRERTGLLFRSGDSADLVAKVRWAVANPDRLAFMRKQARTEYESKYRADSNYRQLMAIYDQAWSRTAPILQPQSGVLPEQV